MPSNPLPAFVDYPSGQTLPGPVAFEGVTMWSFPLEANFATLTELCDKLIARPSGGRVRFAPLSTSVLMNFTVFPRAIRRSCSRGLATERELSLAIPGIYSRFVGPVPVEIGFALFMPLMFLDNPVAMMTGRENTGFLSKLAGLACPMIPTARCSLLMSSAVRISARPRSGDANVLFGCRRPDPRRRHRRGFACHGRMSAMRPNKSSKA